MTAWDAFNTGSPRRRIRGGEIPPAHPVAWREQARARLRLVQAAAPTAAEPNPAVMRVLGFPIDLDAVFAAALFTPMLFIANWATMGAAMVAAMVPLYLFVRREKLGAVLIKRSLLFALPAFALMSVVWSEAPKETFKLAIEFGITVLAGVLISSGRNQAAVIRGLAVAFAAYAAMALVSGGHVKIGVGAGGEAFSGLTESKNLLADIASTGLIVSLAVIAMAVRGRAWLWLGFGVVAAAMELYAVTAARSAGALLGLGLGIVTFGALLALIAAGRAVRAWLTSVLAIVLVGVGLNYAWLSQLMIQTAADVFDKDPTLTGRTYLWYRAADLIQEHPLLGRGYQAFWLQGNVDAEGLWRYFGITERSGFTFHNTLVEILVTLGWLGVLVVGLVVIGSAIALIRRFVLRPNLALCFWTAVFFYQLARTPIESIGLAPFYFSTALAFAALGAAWGRAGAKKIASRAPYAPPQPRVVQAWPVEQIPAQWAGQRPRAGVQRLRLVETKAPR